MRRLLIALTLLLLSVPMLRAEEEERATLVADSVTVQSGSTLAAEGNVEVFFKGQRLTADAIIYDQVAGRLIINGPIRIEDGTGSFFLADQADLSADLTEGLLTSARLVLNQQLQLAAAEITRSDGGNVTAMRRVVASSCTICAGNPTPLWEIRAREVVHDAAEQQIYFSHANLRFFGVPVLYLPVLRVPDPDLKRANGFLLPKLRSTTALGLGLKLPYFFTLGSSRDLTVTPYLTQKGGETVELRYRQAFTEGMLVVEGALSHDSIGRTGPRGYLTGYGSFNLGNAFILSFSGISVSDDGYLADYGIPGGDRLESQVALSRVTRDLAFSARLSSIQSLRDSDNNGTLPAGFADLSAEKRFTLPILGGSAGLRLASHNEHRTSTSPADSDGDGTSDGRDLGRVSLGFDWNRNWTTSGGIVLSAMGEASLDSYSIAQDAAYGGAPRRLSGAAGVELRWPWVKAGRATQVLEPVVQLVTSGGQTAKVPNSDSTLVELDEGNLFALDRYPGADAVETGTRVNLGLTYTRDVAEGWSLGVTGGRVVRLADDGQFSAASGLDGLRSDWLLAWSLDSGEGLAVTNRLTVDDALSVTKGELRFDYTRASTTLSGGYEYLPADAEETRAETASEIRLNAKTELASGWIANIGSRYDLKAARLAQSSLALNFRNECLDVALSLSRSYASSSSLTPSTDFGLSVELLGFGGGGAVGPSRTCRR